MFYFTLVKVFLPGQDAGDDLVQKPHSFESLIDCAQFLPFGSVIESTLILHLGTRLERRFQLFEGNIHQLFILVDKLVNVTIAINITLFATNMISFDVAQNYQVFSLLGVPIRLTVVVPGCTNLEFCLGTRNKKKRLIKASLQITNLLAFWVMFATSEVVVLV